VTTYPAAGALAHPIWHRMGYLDGAISLAPYRAWEGLAKFAGPCAAFGLGALSVRRSLDRDGVGRMIVAAGFAFALAAFGNYPADLANDQTRLTAGLGSANAAATVFDIFFLSSIVMAIRAARAKRRQGANKGFFGLLIAAPASWTLALICITGLFMTASRGGALALAIAGMGLVFAILLAAPPGDKPSSAGRRMALMISVPAAAFGLFGAQALAKRFLNFNDNDFSGRVELVTTHWRAFLDRPLFGHGLGSFHEISSLYANPENWRGVLTAGAAHNIFVQCLEETGVIGFALFCAMLLPPIWRATSAAFRPTAGQTWAAFAFVITLLVMAHGMIDFGLNVPVIACLYAFILGFGARRKLPD
jgi:O-antigen ligase